MIIQNQRSSDHVGLGMLEVIMNPQSELVLREENVHLIRDTQDQGSEGSFSSMIVVMSAILLGQGSAYP